MMMTRQQLMLMVVSALMVLPTAEAWDFWTILLNFVTGPLACGPGIPREFHDTCRKCAGPLQQDMCSCKALCDMYDSSSSDRFFREKTLDFCDRYEDIQSRQSYTSDATCSSSSYSGGQSSGYSQSSSTTSAAASEVDGYAGKESGGVGGASDITRSLQWWMAGVAASVAMALIAIVIGQRRENRDRDADGDRALLSGAVGRRLNAVAAFADGVLPTRRNRTKEQVTEMSGYKLETEPSAVSTGSGGSRGDDENNTLGGYESAYA